MNDLKNELIKNLQKKNIVYSDFVEILLEIIANNKNKIQLDVEKISLYLTNIEKLNKETEEIISKIESF